VNKKLMISAAVKLLFVPAGTLAYPNSTLLVGKLHGYEQ